MSGAGSFNITSAVFAVLGRHGPARRYLLACSGGRDSTVLAHLLAGERWRLPGPLLAVHVDHGLNPQSAQWADACRRACARLGIACEVLRVDGRPPAGESVEAWARRARYAAMTARMQPGDTLLTAHHRDDQAETLLLALLRGSGPHGLRGMAECRELAPGTLLRPLLGVAGDALERYARLHGLRWIEDDSNTDQRLDRNFLRHGVLPRLAARWPRHGAALARAARWQSEVSAVLDEVAVADLAAVSDAAGGLRITALVTLTPARRANALRHWIRTAGYPVPGHRRLEAIAASLLGTGAGKGGRVVWNGAQLHRYRDVLHLLPPLGLARPDVRTRWNIAEPLYLPGGVLRARPGTEAGLAPPPASARVEVGFRRGGERLRLPGRDFHAQLKKLFQAAGVPPWQRDRLPLVYVDGELAAVAGHWVAASFAAAPASGALQLEWLPE
ncbi:MAG: tRNA lysidine(34) synthetase TilS [Gammaproteobacteria bacterium]|nr:tRNA lysidine(34) synthetase TilS [Gammaproteobacteria bacterium]